jgi:predicted DCC family thiol-disulfide oxidoreductase YuxK
MATKVYYNSACPVCNAGIEDQRKRMEARGIRDVEWIDVHAHPEAVEQVGSPLEQVRERLHVKAADGPLEVGADAFTRLWLQTPGQRWLGKLLRLPVFKQITHVVYNAFARLLYLWNRAKGHW